MKLPPLPDGFEPVLTDVLAKLEPFIEMMGHFSIQKAGEAAGSWEAADHIAATEAAIQRVIELIEKDLIRFGRHTKTGEIALFLAEQVHFTDQQEWADADMLLGYFRVTGDYDHRTGELIPTMPQSGYPVVAGQQLVTGTPVGHVGTGNQFVQPGDPVFKLEERTIDDWLAMYPLATRTLAEDARVSKRLVEDILRRWSDAKTLRWIFLPEHQTEDVSPHSGIYGLFPGKPPETPTGAEKAVFKLFSQTWDVSHPKVLPEFAGRIAMSETAETPGAIYWPDKVETPPADHAVINVETWANDSQIDLSRIAAAARMSKRVVLERLTKLQARGFFRVYRKVERQGGEPDILRFQAKDIESLEPQDRVLIDALSSKFPTDQLGRIQMGLVKTATYMAAIEQQYTALTELTKIAAAAAQKGTMMFEGMTAAELWQVDIAILKRADTYCWFPEQTNAVEAASVSLPTSVRLTRDLVDGYSGWWYFTAPLDIQTTAEDTQLVALLWSWTSESEPSPFHKRRAGITFSAYVANERVDGGKPLPSTKFFWPEGATFDQMMIAMAQNYDERYHPGSIASKSETTKMGKQQTLEAIERMARFFAAGALWIQQRILNMTPGAIGRQNRKRMEREAFHRPLTDVQVIQLRRKQNVRVEPAGETQERNWKCRWIVSGFWRNQYYPSKGRHEPKWINAFIKGPEGLPLKVPQHRIYTVNR